jgi:hypothetical protein
VNQPDQTGETWAWRTAWLDVLAFAAWLTLAWGSNWRTTDLVWSLWLSSLLIGYSLIFWGIFGPIMGLLVRAHDRRKPLAGQLVTGSLSLIGGLVMLAFFTIHFGGFHFIHSIFLGRFFPLGPDMNFPSVGAYLAIFRRYWPYVLFAAVAERHAFRWAVTKQSAEAAQSSGIAAPYLNVIRMHLLIFFFVFAKIVGLENAWVYIVVYAVYFFPWRLLRRPKPVGDTAHDQ